MGVLAALACPPPASPAMPVQPPSSRRLCGLQAVGPEKLAGDPEVSLHPWPFGYI